MIWSPKTFSFWQHKRFWDLNLLLLLLLLCIAVPPARDGLFVFSLYDALLHSIRAFADGLLVFIVDFDDEIQISDSGFGKWFGIDWFIVEMIFGVQENIDYFIRAT